MRPRSSEARSPVNSAVRISGRHRPSSLPAIALTSAGVGMSTPTRSLRRCCALLRFFLRLRERTTFCATKPPSCASASSIDSAPTTLVTMLGDRGAPTVWPGAGVPSSNRARKSLIIGAVNLESFSAPRYGAI